MNITIDEIETDYYAHFYFDNPNAANADEDEDFDLNEVLQSMETDDWETVSADGN